MDHPIHFSLKSCISAVSFGKTKDEILNEIDKARFDKISGEIIGDFSKIKLKTAIEDCFNPTSAEKFKSGINTLSNHIEFYPGLIIRTLIEMFKSEESNFDIKEACTEVLANKTSKYAESLQKIGKRNCSFLDKLYHDYIQTLTGYALEVGKKSEKSVKQTEKFIEGLKREGLIE